MIPLQQIRRHAARGTANIFFYGLAGLGYGLPQTHARLYGIKKHYDIPYTPEGDEAHLMDIYVPPKVTKDAAVVMYIHGGGFHICSKETHKIFAVHFAREGYIVCNINYRLAPKHPFPAAIEDVCTAYAWIVKNIEQYGGDPNKLIVAGESAGANLALSLGIANTFIRKEAYAKAVYALKTPPKAVIAMSGILEVSNIQRLKRQRVSQLHYDVASFPEEEYLPASIQASGMNLDLANPLLLMESAKKPRRKFPPVFASAGTADPILADTERLEKALQQRNITHAVQYYANGIHAFQAFVIHPSVNQHWTRLFEFLDRQKISAVKEKKYTA